MKNTKKLQDTIGYKFKNEKLINTALTHRSFINESSNSKSNERMEFLGDSVLGFCVTQYLYQNFHKLDEGELSKLRASVVCEETLAKIASEWNLGEYLVLGVGEDKSGGRKRKSILSDAVESVIAAVFLDGGIECAQKLVLHFITKYIDNVKSGERDFDYKTKLQEIIYAKGKNINYKILEESGPDHSKTYYVSVLVDNEEYGRGRGSSKKKAEQDAASKALEKIESGEQK